MPSIRILKKYVDSRTVKYVVRPEPAPKVWIAKIGFHLSTLASLFLMADVTDKKTMWFWTVSVWMASEKGHYLTPFYPTAALKKNKEFNYWVLKQERCLWNTFIAHFFLEQNVLKINNHAVAVYAKATVKLCICPCINTHTRIWNLWPVTRRSSHTDNIQCLRRASLFS